LRIPQKDYVIVSEIMRLGHLISQDYEDNDVLLDVEIPIALANKLKPYSIEP
jgi:GTP-binding protein HflX